MLRIVAILHNPAGSTGLIGKFLDEQPEVDFRVLCPLAGDPLPEADTFDAAIVFGGKMSANDCPALPPLLSELLWIRGIVDAGKPFLGICLGAQLLAMAYGGKITRHAEHIRSIRRWTALIRFLPRCRSAFFSGITRVLPCRMAR